MKVVYKWNVPVDDRMHEIGSGRVVHVACMGSPDVVQVWTEEELDLPGDAFVSEYVKSGERLRRIIVIGTGQLFSDDGTVVGTAISGSGRLVWHVVSYDE